MLIHTHSHKTVLKYVNYGMGLCAACRKQCAVCGWPAFKFMQCAALCGRAHNYVRQSSSVRGSVRGNVRLSGSVCGSVVRLSSSAAVCGSPPVSIFLNKFKTYSHNIV
jgi:hypothetical protein